MKVHYQDDPQSELHLPDERRRFTLAPSMPGCSCGHQAALERGFVAREEGGGFQQSFRVCCSLQASGGLSAADDGWLYQGVHTEATPWLSSPKEAVQHWRVVAALTK